MKMEEEEMQMEEEEDAVVVEGGRVFVVFYSWGFYNWFLRALEAYV